MNTQSLNDPRTGSCADHSDAPHDEPSLSPSKGERRVIRMTMAEWKRIHRDFKGNHVDADGTRWRSVLRPGGLVPVEIIKE